MGMDRCIGIIHFIRESGSKDYSKAKANYGKTTNLLKRGSSKMARSKYNLCKSKTLQEYFKASNR